MTEIKMKQGLLEINELVGTWGSLIINNHGDIIAIVTPPGLNQVALANITNHIVDLLSSAGKKIAGLTEGVFHYIDRKIFILDLEQVILVVICTPSVDISLLRMTVNVIVTNWQADRKVMEQFHDHYVGRV
jgi:predicted regulator of Ras-like GTPase activity (Roadblock/LC7/MglB family)